jgi:hypothetical protein
MLRCVRAALFLVAVLAAGCPGGGVRNGGGGGGTGAPTELTIPAVPGAADRLVALGRTADRGAVEAAWTRAHYLLDLYDDARFRRADDSLDLLRGALGIAAASPRRGAAATDEVIGKLLIEVDRVLRLDRRHHAAQQARTLLETEQKPPTDRTQLRQRVIELKSVAAGRTLAGNARLRLFGLCRTALGDAIRMRWADRAQTMVHCLYPLYGADPEPYFDADPLKRPPLPRWRDLADALAQLGAAIAGGGDRTAPAGKRVAAELAEFMKTAAEELPDPIEPAALGLPRAQHASPYEWTPLIPIGTGAKLLSVEDYTGLVDAQLQGDGREAVAVAIAEAADLEALRRATAAATAAGARWIEVTYGLPQTLAVPEGDYWHGKLDGAAFVPGVIAVNLSTAPPAATSDPRRQPHAPPWEPDRARLGLHLVVEAHRWHLIAPGGEVASVPTGQPGGDRGTELRTHLARVRAAFANESGLLVVAGDGATWASVAEAIALSARDAQGRPLFDRLAFAAAPPKPAGPQTLGQRIDRRFRAQVTITAEGLEGRIAGIRACYQDQLEKRPELAGTVVVGGSGKVDAGLRACAERGVEALMKERKVDQVTIVMRPR